MNKLKLFSLFAAVMFAASMWGQSGETEGPWTWMGMRSGCCDRTVNYSIAFDGLNNSHWGNISFWNDGDGIGYTVKGTSANQQKNGVFSTYYIDQNVDSYSKKVLTWKFKVGSKDTKHYSNTALYALQGTWQQINALTVDFTEEYNNQAGSSYLIGRYRNTSYNKAYTGEITKTFEFNNYQGSSATTKSWCLLLTHVVSSGDGMSDIHEWGAFQSVSATWTTYYYKYVTFNGNGSTSGSMSKQTIENSGKLTANAFSRTGYTFDGWATSSTGSKAYDNQGDISATSGSKGNVTLYARWKANTYTVSFNQQSGSGGSSSVQATYGSAMPSATMPTRKGYTFNGYFDAASGGTQYYKADGTSARTWNKTANTTLYAQWTVNKYTVTFDKQNGTGGSNNVSATYGSAMPSATMPTRAGYTFQGYYDAQTGGNQYYKADGSSAKNWDKAANTTLYARWNPITYTITYDYAKGEGNNPATYNPDMETFQLAAPTRLGYTFIGWTGSNGNTPQTTVQIAKGSTGNRNYTANWAINPNTNVVYLDSLDNTAAQEIVAFNRPEAPEVAGFTFVRWAVIEGPLSEGIKLQAVYAENEPSGAPKKQVGKFTLTRKGDTNEYILQTAK